MKTPTIDATKIKRIEQLTNLRAKSIFAAATGNYKMFKDSRKSFAKLAVEDFDTVRKLPPQKPITVPFFSKEGLNMLKVWILDKFRCKTAEEKQLAIFGKDEAARRKLDINT